MSKGSEFAPDNHMQRELWGLALLALSLLLLLSLVPTSWLGATGARLFPTGNIVGLLGRLIQEKTWMALGVPVVLLPLYPGIWAAAMVHRLDRERAWQLTSLFLGLQLLIPVGLYALARPLEFVPSSSGWIGVTLGGLVTTLVGWLGAALLIAFLIAMLFRATMDWNPLRSLAGGGAFLWSGMRRTAVGIAGRVPRFSFPRRAKSPSAKPRRKKKKAAAPAESDAQEAEAPDWELTDVFGEEETLDPLHEPAAATAVAGAREPATTAPVVARERGRRKAAAEQAEMFQEVVTEDPGDLEATDLPTTQFLTVPPSRDEAGDRRALDQLGQALIEKLSTFKISGEIVGVTTGPVVTQFEVSPAPGIKVSRIANLDADLALALRAPSVRIVAPIPGKGAVGVEVPNPEPQTVFFREVIEAPSFRNSKAQLPLALGKDIAGRPYVADLAKMPHLLIAGATGSGKSVCVNTIITSLVYRHSPRSLRLLMVDPKMVELSMYNDLPHLRHPVVTDNNEAAGVLKWAVLEMERRYGLLSANGVRNLQDFNRRLENGQVMRTPEADGEEGDPERWIYKGGPLPYIVLIIDELADLMMTVQGDVEKPLALLAQKSRAIGIHLILATQRPSVNVITGLIKANFPSRIAFRVSSKVDSRTILDQNGADNLLGTGDMLFLPPGQSDPVRVQGAFLSTEETEQLMGWYREQAEQRKAQALAEGLDPDEVDEDEEDILAVVRAHEGDGGDADGAGDVLEDRDKLFREAAELCIQHQGGSTSLLQRRLRIGYGRAARIIDQLHNAGVLGPPDGSKPRDVLMDLLQLEQLFPDE